MNTTAISAGEKMFLYGMLFKAISDKTFVLLPHIKQQLLEFLHAKYLKHADHHALLRESIEDPQNFPSIR